MMKQDLTSYCKYILNTDDFVVFEDAGYSGKNTDRPAYQKMMSQIRQGLFTHLLVWKIDRISRNLLDFANMYAELKDLGVTFVSKNEQFDTSTAIGEAMLKIILVFAELERIGMMSQEPWMRTMNDEEFIRQASSFILTQKLADKQYIYYENLAESLDPEILKNFFVSILDSIILRETGVRKRLCSAMGCPIHSLIRILDAKIPRSIYTPGFLFVPLFTFS